MRRFAKLLGAAITAGLVAFPSLFAAEPTAEHVLAACQRALEKGFKGIEADICDWYITPCPCEFVAAAAEAQWCLPQDLDSAALAQHVVDELSRQPQSLSEPASLPIIKIVRAAYPCDK